MTYKIDLPDYGIRPPSPWHAVRDMLAGLEPRTACLVVEWLDGTRNAATLMIEALGRAHRDTFIAAGIMEKPGRAVPGFPRKAKSAARSVPPPGMTDADCAQILRHWPVCATGTPLDQIREREAQFAAEMGVSLTRARLARRYARKLD